MLEKTFQPGEIEPRQYELWEKSGAFAADPQSSDAPFCVMMPPPNVTGSLHMGHALNASLQDILTRYWRMKGRDALWQPGMDHAGIATQMVVERQLDAEGLNRRDMGREAFLERVWEWKAQSGGTIAGQLRRLGASPDWERERFTMDEGLSRAVRKVFVELYSQGLIYRDKRLVNWDPKLLTAVSDLEVEHREIKGKMYHFRYPYEDGSGAISIATTRPETILADGAVAVHPDDERYKDLIGKNVVVPVVNRIIPIIADEYVKSDFGSGAVKITAAHDFNDFAVYKRHPDKEIVLINLFTPDGKMNENVPDEYVGLDRFEAREKVIADFDDLDYLDKIEDHVHQVPYGDRSGVVIEPYLTDQWYVDAKVLAAPAIRAVEDGRVEFVPKNWENTYFEWMRNIQPWCISRQLWWGHRIPAWYGPGGEVFVAHDEQEAYAQAREKLGEAAEEDLVLTQDEDVLDTWFSSALWPFSTLGWPEDTPELGKYYPGDVLITAFDIIFFWVARMIMMGLHFMDDVPFRKVYMHALVRDGKGQKMSKSKGNIINPLDLIERYGADALRFTLCAMAAQGRDIRLSESRVEGYRNFATKLWNAARYCEMNRCLPEEGFCPSSVHATSVAAGEAGEADGGEGDSGTGQGLTHNMAGKWIVERLRVTCAAMEEALQSYRFNDAAHAIYQFVRGDFCDWYLEFTKPVLHDAPEDDPQAREVRQTAGWVLDQILLLLNPFMPYITEELYAKLGTRPKEALLISSAWPDYSHIAQNGQALAEIDWVIRLISEIRSIRADMNVPPAARIGLLIKGAGEDARRRLRDYDPIIRQMARLETVELWDKDVPAGSIQTVLDEATLILPIADIVDLTQERGRLEKEIAKLEQNISQIDTKLANKKFIANAPEEVIAEQKARKEESEGVLSKLTQALQQINAA